MVIAFDYYSWPDLSCIIAREKGIFVTLGSAITAESLHSLGSKFPNCFEQQSLRVVCFGALTLYFCKAANEKRFHYESATMEACCNTHLSSPS